MPDEAAIWLGSLPTTWTRTRLKYVMGRIDGGTWGEEPTADDDPICIRAADFDRIQLRVSDAKVVQRHVSKDLLRYLLNRGDLILEKSGGGADSPVGLAVVFDLERRAICSNFTARLRAGDLVEASYLKYLLAGIYFMGLTRRSINQTTGIQNLDLDALLHEEWAIPDRPAQRKIVQYLDNETRRVDDLVSAKRHIRTLLADERAAIVEAGIAGGFSDRRRGSVGLPWLPSVPEGWNVARLQYIARLGSGHTPSRQHPEWWQDCAIPWITTGDIHNFRDDRLEVVENTEQHISELGLANSAAELHPKGTVVLSRTASVGFSAIMGRDMATSQDFATWTCSNAILPEFLLYCLRAMRRDLLGRLVQGSTHQTIYMPDIERIMVPLPPADEQRAIVAEIRMRLRPIDELLDAIDAQLPKLAEYRRALITDAVTGKLSVAL